MNRRVLMVDDDERVLRAYQRSMRMQFELEIAQGPEPALTALQVQAPFAVIVADMQMPGMNGIDLLKRVMEVEPETVRIMLTGNADQGTAVEAVNEGQIFRFLNKPCAVPDLTRALEAGIEQHRLITAERELLENTLSGSVDLLTELLAASDPVTFGRAQEVAEYATTMGKMLKVQEGWNLKVAALLAQIGRITVPRALLDKVAGGTPLSAEERAVIARIPESGAKLLAHIPRLEEVARIIRYQAKGYDGRGFPYDDVHGEDLPLAARILACAQAYAELEAGRKVPIVVVEELKRQGGRFDPKVLVALEQLVVPAEEGVAPVVPERVSLRELAPGMTLAEDARTRDGVLLFAKGARLGPTHLEKLENFAKLTGIREPFLILRASK